MSDFDPLTIVCPVCRAKPGEPCLNIHGTPYWNGTHYARRIP